MQKQYKSDIIILNNNEYKKEGYNMAITISIALQKGGVGKTTTALNLASTLGFKGRKVLLIDMDDQCNTTYASGVDRPAKTITDVLGDECTVDEAIIQCKYYDILAADDYLANVGIANVKSTLLKDAIDTIKNRYDYIIIDTPPALGNLSYTSLVASDYVIVPAEPRPFALQGLGALHRTISSIQKRQNPNLKVLGILLIKYNNRTVLNRDVKDLIDDFSKKMNTKLFSTTIREGVAVGEAQMLRKPLIDYAKSSKPNIDYKALTTEILHMLEGEE